MRKSLTLTLAALTLAAGLTGCSSGTTTTTPAAPAAKAPAAAPAKTAAPHVTTWGDTVTWPSGVKATVKLVGVKKASATAAGAAPDGTITVFSVTVTNGSTQPISAGMMGMPTVTYGADGEQATNAVDFDLGYTGTFRTINPGETQTVKATYGIPTAGRSQVRVEVQGPDMLTDSPAVFKGSVK